jgi:hypothetical protein
MSWSIDSVAGHCAHSSGLNVYIAEGESARYIRCLGPFGCPSMNESEVKDISGDLSQQLETLKPDYFVVWGAYLDRAEYWEHRFSILGSYCGFVPNLAYRDEVVDQAFNDNPKRNWTEIGDNFVHYSGAIYNFANGILDAGNVDPALLHPETASALLTRLVELAFFSSNDIGKESIQVDLRGVAWDPCTPRLHFSSQIAI